MSLAANLENVRQRIELACRRASRSPEDVRLVAVSKTMPAESVREAYAAGQREFGENRVQEAALKARDLAELDITWHLIGHLQSNKTGQACGLFDWIQSVDSLHLAGRINRSAADIGCKVPVLIEVHLGEEASKFGVEEDQLAELAGQVGKLPSLELRGLMTLPPYFDDPEGARPFFRRLRQLAARIEALQLPGVSMHELSMGMSHDFEIAIEEGATIVRVGTAIFGPRNS